jgi:hypothetical protein
MKARVTDGPLPEVVPSVSEADLQASRQRISVFLSTHTVYDLLPESGKVWMLYHLPSFETHNLLSNIDHCELVPNLKASSYRFLPWTLIYP